MSKNSVYSADNKQLDIVDEAIDLRDAARSEVYEMNFAEALEVMKIERLDLLCCKIEKLNETISKYL